MISKINQNSLNTTILYLSGIKKTKKKNQDYKDELFPNDFDKKKKDKIKDDEQIDYSNENYKQKKGAIKSKSSKKTEETIDGNKMKQIDILV